MWRKVDYLRVCWKGCGCGFWGLWGLKVGLWGGGVGEGGGGGGKGRVGLWKRWEIMPKADTVEIIMPRLRHLFGSTGISGASLRPKVGG